MHKEQVYRSTVASPSEFENEQGQNFFLCFKKRKIFASMKKHKKDMHLKIWPIFRFRSETQAEQLKKFSFMISHESRKFQIRDSIFHLL